MTLKRWDPVREVMAIRNAMDRLVEENQEALNRSRTLRLPLDAYSTENEIVVLASVPGVDPDTVEITIEGETLTIRGEIPHLPENVDPIFNERFHGPFSRTLQLNVPVDVEHIQATFDDGILTLLLPKAEEIRPRVIRVNATHN
ncbi:MAG: Hsp20/alpha crystallin family protein [Chloroflexi bacterium]|nr:Hsp20/alpha crystallin family protein [Chloroflexota bacterium]